MRIAICEDLAEDTARIQELLLDYLDRNSLIAVVDHFPSGEAFMARFVPGLYQIIFMDIFMKEDGMTGMDTAERIRERDQDAAVILTTSSEDFLRAGYRVAVYYMVKPATKEEFAVAMGKCRTQLNRFAKSIQVMIDRKSTQIRLRDIYFVESQQRTSVFYLKKGELRTNTPTEALIEELGGFPFVQCHRSFSVNLVHVSEMLERDFLLDNNRKVPISRAYLAQSQHMFRQYIKAKIIGEQV